MTKIIQKKIKERKRRKAPLYSWDTNFHLIRKQLRREKKLKRLRDKLRKREERSVMRKFSKSMVLNTEANNPRLKQKSSLNGKDYREQGDIIQQRV